MTGINDDPMAAERFIAMHAPKDTPKPRMMTLQAALSTLERAHTRDDELTGYVVESLPRIEDWERAAYVEAWGIVRDHVRHDPAHVGPALCNVCNGPITRGCCNPGPSVCPICCHTECQCEEI